LSGSLGWGGCTVSVGLGFSNQNRSILAGLKQFEIHHLYNFQICYSLEYDVDINDFF